MKFEDITFKTSGTGPAVLFVPGSFSTPSAWRSLQAALPQRYRFISTSLLGYGNTTETRSPGDFDIAHEVLVLKTVGKMIDEPFHIVGHSFGATVAFAALFAGVIDVLSITTFEANPIALIDEESTMDLFQAVQRFGVEFEFAYQSKEHFAARRVIDYWGGEGSFAAMPDAVQNYCQATTISNILDWHTVYTLDARQQDYQQLTQPALIVCSEFANPAMLAITKALIDALPNTNAAVVKGANHFLINSHAVECATLLANHLEKFA